MKNVRDRGEIGGPPEDFNRLLPDARHEGACLETFALQYAGNPVYRRYSDCIGKDPDTVKSVWDIPFLPVSFFKTHRVLCGEGPVERVFESSGTTGASTSRHHVRDLSLYERSYKEAFRLFYGDPRDWCILALLPSYLQRGGSSLVAMAEGLIRMGGDPTSGFFLDQFASLAATLAANETAGRRTMLLGVTYALLDFADAHPMPLRHTVVMETGGMKGRRGELTREEVHERLCRAFSLNAVHSEYGMTELLSQAYSSGCGRFRTPPWMRVLLRSEDDPLSLLDAGGVPNETGLVNIIDLANIHSCSFIATDDLGRLHPDGSFEVLGRLDNSDIRGCSLLAV